MFLHHRSYKIIILTKMSKPCNFPFPSIHFLIPLDLALWGLEPIPAISRYIWGESHRNKQTHSHPRVTNYPNKHVFELWGEARKPKAHRCTLHTEGTHAGIPTCFCHCEVSVLTTAPLTFIFWTVIFYFYKFSIFSISNWAKIYKV